MFVWLCGGGQELPRLFIMRSGSNPRLTLGDVSPCQRVPVEVHTHTHTQLRLYVVFVMVV